jgi:hypothetical protein
MLQNATSMAAITTAYLQQGNSNIQYHSSMQDFGSGNSFEHHSLKNIRFDKALEFGYGEILILVYN